MNKQRIQSADDYSNPVPPTPPKPLVVSSKLVTPNKFQILEEFPPISYSQILRNPSLIRPSFSQAKAEASASKALSTKYIQKPSVEHITLTKFTKVQDLQTLRRITENYFSKDCNWYSDDSRKTQKYYEYILVDTQSIELSHSMDPTNPDKIAYSKCSIKRILKSDDWISDPFTEKKFSKPFSPPGYTYPDYKMAWSRAFFKRSFDHSWFFSFHTDFLKHTYPIWFLQWWFDFGPIRQILPNDVLQALDYYIKESNEEPHLKEVQYFSEFRVPWIMCWNFTFRQHFPYPMPISIVREFRVKWWQNYTTKYCDTQAVRHFIQTGEKPKWDIKTAQSIPNPSTPAQKSAIKQKGVQKTPSLTQRQIKMFELLEDSPETASQYLEFIKMQQQKKSEPTSSEGSSSDDPFGGPCAQDPFDF